MKNQIFFLILFVTSCYCQNQTTEADVNQVTKQSESNNTQVNEETTSEDKNITTTVKTTIITKISTTTKITPYSENPALKNISADIFRLVSDFLPHLLSKPDQVKSFETDKNTLFNELEKLKEINWEKNCSLARIYLKMLEDEFVKKQDKEVVSEERLKKLIPCKRDCNFDRLIKANYSEDNKNFSKTFLPHVSPDVAQFCQNTLGKYLAVNRNDSKPLDLSEISALTDGSLPLGSLFTQSQIATIPASDALDVIKKFKEKIDDQSARKLGKKIPTNTSLADVAHIAAFVPAEVLSNASPDDLINNMDSFSEKIDNKKALLVASKIASDGTKEQFKSFLNKADSKFSEKISLSTFNKFNLTISELPDAAIPSSFRENFLTNSLTGGKTVADLDESVLKTVVTKISRSELDQVPKEKKKDTVLSLLKASTNSSKTFSSSQRSAFMDSFLQSWADKNDSQKLADFEAMSTEDIEAIAEVIVSANESVYSWLRSSNKFSIVIEKNSKMDSTKCCTFLYRSRVLYATEAIKKLVSSASNINSNHLTSLGPCFASLIPKEYLSNLASSDIESQIEYFNTQAFQPNSSVFDTLKTKLNGLYETKATDIDKTSILSKMGSIMVFMDEAKVSQNLIKNSVSLMLTSIKNERNVQNDEVAKCRIGSGDDDKVTDYVNNWNKHLVGAWFTLSSSRRKRSTTKLTCDTVNQIASAIDLVSESYFTSMEQAEFEKCIETLGSNEYSLTAAQYAELAKKKDISLITDSDIQIYNKILTGYSNTDLAKLSIESLTSVQALGQIDSFSTDQINSLVTALKSKLGSIDNDKLNYLGNLACGLTSSDIDQITDLYFKENIKAVSLIDTANCPGMTLLYAKAKKAMDFSTLTSVQVAEIGSVAAGISTDEVKNLDSRAIQAMSTNTLKIIPASIVNSFSAVQIQSLSSDQLSSLINSPNADQFSAATKTLLTSASQNIDVTRTDVLSEVTGTSASTSIHFNIMLMILPIFFRFY